MNNMSLRRIVDIKSIGKVFLFICMAAIAHGQSPYSTNELLIKFEPGTSISEINEWKDSLSAEELAVSPLSEIRLWKIMGFPTNNGYTDINETVVGSKGKAKVNSAGLNYTVALPSIDEQGNPISWSPTEFCPEFSTICTTGTSGVKVAILDTGIGYTYRHGGGSWEFCVPSLFDPVFGGYIGYDFANNDAEPQDDHGHGTHIAGIIAELGAESGVPLQLESFKTHDHEGAGNVFDIILATDRAVIKGNHILNMSFSYQAPPPSEKPEPLEVAIDMAGANGALVVAAAGNDNQNNDTSEFPSYPASFICENIIAVISASCEDDLSTFSSYGGNSTDLAILGEYIVGPNPEGEFVLKSGTSQATAIVSGIAAQLASDLTEIHHIPLKCALLNGAESEASLESLTLTEGLTHAENAHEELVTTCGIGYRSSESIPENYIEKPNELSVSPNPFSHQLEIILPKLDKHPVSVIIYDSMGKTTWKRENITEQKLIWQPNHNTPAGLYFIQATFRGGIFSQAVFYRN